MEEDPTAIPRVATVSKAGLMLLLAATSLAGLSALTHTRIHGVALMSRMATLTVGTLALVKVANHLALHLPKPVSRLIHWVRAMTLELLAWCAVALLRCTRLFRTEWPRVGSATGRPIVLVHGYCNHSSVWIYLRHQLANAGLGPIYTVDLGSPFGSMREHVERLREKVEAVRRETGRADLTLVGHSMGGLVSALYATNAPDVRVITIGSPLQGTHIAAVAPGACGREMRRESQILSELGQRLRSSPHIHLRHIASRTDQLVVPSSSALLETAAERQCVLEDIGHTSMLFSPRVAAQLIAWLR